MSIINGRGILMATSYTATDLDSKQNGGRLFRSIPNSRSYFFKADSFPEALANERKDGRSLDDSCYEPIGKLRARADKFR